MSALERLTLGALARIDPERAHKLALLALKTPFAPGHGPFTSPRLETELAGLKLPNPIGLAAGFDKNAEAIMPLSRAGFGFLEVGAATPKAQEGNRRPRLFRLPEDRAVINRFGFNNQGIARINQRLRVARAKVPVGLNLGANKDSNDRAMDYAEVLLAARDYIDFATVNVSSPNTENLRDLQGPAALRALLDGVMEVRGDLPVFVKIAPDLRDSEIAEIGQVAMDAGLQGIIATNTTLSRNGLKSFRKKEAGGLSGRPLFTPSTRVLARLYKETGGAIPLVGVGGVESASDAYAKIRAGASAVQLYSAMIYWGLSLVDRIARGVDECLSRDGYANVADAVGTDTERWL